MPPSEMLHRDKPLKEEVNRINENLDNEVIMVQGPNGPMRITRQVAGEHYL